MKQISIEELKKKIQPGDLIYIEYADVDLSEHMGWHLVFGAEVLGVNTESVGSHTSLSTALRDGRIKFVIFPKDVEYFYKVGAFLHDFKEKGIIEYATEVTYPTTRETEIATLIAKLESQLSDAKGELTKIKEGK